MTSTVTTVKQTGGIHSPDTISSYYTIPPRHPPTPYPKKKKTLLF